jgi:recombination protein RecR
MSLGPLENLIKSLAGLPGLGPRSARRIALHLASHKEENIKPLITSLSQAYDNIKSCNICANLDCTDTCHICSNPKRDDSIICVVSSVADLWAIERTSTYNGKYHVLGGVLSALDGIGPEDLNLRSLISRIEDNTPNELILALSATVDGQTTSHYISDKISSFEGIKISKLAHGVPIGGELDYLDDGTISTALKSRSGI